MRTSTLALPSLACLLAIILAVPGIVVTAQGPAADANHLVGQQFTVAPANPLGARQGGSFSDDFNRSDSTNMGPDWLEGTGDLVIMSNAGRGNLPIGWSYMTHTSASGTLATTVMKVDLLPPQGTSGPHVALIAGATGTSWLYTKIQDNDSNGLYDRIYFYSNGNGFGWGTLTSVPLTSQIATGRVTMFVTNGGDRLNVDIDTNFDGIPDQQFQNDGILALGLSGTTYGIGTFAMGAFDNWEVVDPQTFTLQVAQIGGPGGNVIVSNWGLIPGNEYYNVFSIEPCPAGPGTGPGQLLGICATTPAATQFLINQLLLPVGTPPFHFIATSNYVAFPALSVPPVVLDGICLDVTSGVATPIIRITIQ